MNDSDALAEEIDPAADALHKAILAQRYKANKDNLEALIRQAEAIDLSAYTEESAAVFRTALEEAKALMADETLSEDDQAQVDQAVLTLQAAMNALEPVDPDKPGGEDPDDPGQTTPTPGGSDGGNSGNGQNTQNGNKPSGNGSTQKPGGAQTGDSRNMGLWALTLGAAAVLLTGTVVYKKKRG